MNQYLEREWLAGFQVHHGTFFYRVSGLAKYRKGSTQVFTQAAFTGSGGRLVFFGENILGQLIAVGFQNFQFPPFGQARRGQFTVLEVAGSAAVLPIEEVFVGPFKVECVGQRFAHFRIAENVAPGVHGKRLHSGGAAMLDGFGFGFAGVELVALVGSCPVFGGRFHAEVKVAGPERFEGDGVVGIVVVSDSIEIELTFADAEFRCPVILDPLEGN